MKKTLALFFLSFSFNLLAESNLWEGVPLTTFELPDQHGALKANNDFKGQWLVLYFYPKDKTPGCTVEAQNFTNDYALYRNLNTQIVGVSYDDVESHKDFAETYDIPYVLLADTEAKLSKAMKVDRLFPWPHASRQTFVVNPQGVIVYHYADVSPEEHSTELLQLLKQLQTQSDSSSL